jgi:hypothetical protein
MNTTTRMNDDGYGAASFDVAGRPFGYVEIQVLPGLVKVYRKWTNSNAYRLAAWAGRDVVAVAAAVCNGECPPSILADACDECPPCDGDVFFDAGAELRAAS